MKYVSTKSCVNLFRPSLKKKSFGVVWALNDQEMWMESRSVGFLRKFGQNDRRILGHESVSVF